MTDEERIEQLIGEVRALRLYVEAVNYILSPSTEQKEAAMPKSFEEKITRIQDELADRPVALAAFETTLGELVEVGVLSALNLNDQQLH